MSYKKLLLALTALAGVCAFAQAPIGTVTNVEGVATATQGAAGVTLAPGTAIQNGMRIVTTNSGTVSLRMASGCTVTVPPAHGVTVLQTMTCAQLHAAVEPVVSVAAPATLAPDATIVNGVILLGAGGIVAGIVNEVTSNESLSGQ